MATKHKSGLSQRVSKMMANLGALFGRLYGSGNGASIVANQPGRAAAPRRKGQSQRRRKHRRH